MIKKLLPHVVIVLSGILIVLLTIDIFNSNMAFIDNNITRGIIWALTVLSLVSSIISVRDAGR